MPVTIDNLRVDAAIRGKWNIGFFVAGAIFWIGATIVGQIYDLTNARVFWLVGTFFILPVAVLASRLFGADPFTKGNALGQLVGYTHMSVIAMTFPIIALCFVYYPDAMLLVMAIAYCLDFYVMSWAFDTRLFGIHAVVRVVLVSLIWFAAPEWRMNVLPGLVAFLYVVTVVVSIPMRRRWLRVHALL